MEKLPLKFKRWDYDFEQVRRNDKIAIYRQSINGKFAGYEVIIIRKQKHRERIIDNKKTVFEEKELFPGTSSWGDKGWTMLDLDRANEKFDMLTKKLCQ